MTLGGAAFAFFFVAVFIVYWLVPRRATTQNAVLLLASYVFYASWNVRLLPLLGVVTLIDHACARQLGRQDVPEARRRFVFAMNVVCNLGLLAFFKYAGFFAASLQSALTSIGLAPSEPLLRIALPLGVSYYTLTKLGYMIEVYLRRVPPCRSLLTFALFVAFFPQMIAGPIVRAESLLPQYALARRLRPETLTSGASAFFLGFTLKAYVAEWIGRSTAGPVFADHAAYAALGHWMGLVGCALQIFSDFAGYSLLAIGTARFLGIELPQNFNRPFLATSLPDVWRRWHMSLNNWLFDYVFGPLTTGQGWMRGRIALGLFLVLFVSGVWHGGQWTFVLWGTLHGLGLATQHAWDVFYRGLCRKNRAWVARRRSPVYRAAAWVLTQGFFLLTLAIFRAGSLTEARGFLVGLVRGPGSALPQVVSLHLLVTAGFLAIYHLKPSIGWAGAAFQRAPAPVRGVVYAFGAVVLAILLPVGAGAFIYAQF